MPGPGLEIVPSNNLIVLLDGAADEPIAELDHKTPLEWLDKKYIDTLAAHGSFGWTDGKECTHPFLLELLTGKQTKLTRGLVEAYGLSLPVDKEQTAYRLSPAMWNGGGPRWSRPLSEDEAKRMERAVVKRLSLLRGMNPKVFFYGDGKGVIIVDGEPESGLPPRPTEVSLRQARLGGFQRFVEQVAADLDGITVIPWGGGSPDPASRPQLHNLANPLIMLSRDPAALGAAHALGIPKLRVEHLWSGFREAFRLVSLSNVLLHIKEIDEVSHQHSTDLKLSVLWEIDQILQENADMLDSYKISILVDHGTSSVTGDHLEMKVPFCVSEGVVPMESGKRFCESIDDHVPLSRLLQHIMEY